MIECCIFFIQMCYMNIMKKLIVLLLFGVIPFLFGFAWKFNFLKSQIGIKNFGTYNAYSDGTYAKSCDEYRNPTNTKYAYIGSIGDGVYKLNVPGIGLADFNCDMTTNGGGWAIVYSINQNWYNSSSSMDPTIVAGYPSNATTIINHQTQTKVNKLYANALLIKKQILVYNKTTWTIYSHPNLTSYDSFFTQGAGQVVNFVSSTGATGSGVLYNYYGPSSVAPPYYLYSNYSPTNLVYAGSGYGSGAATGSNGVVCNTTNNGVYGNVWGGTPDGKCGFAVK